MDKSCVEADLYLYSRESGLLIRAGFDLRGIKKTNKTNP